MNAQEKLLIITNEPIWFKLAPKISSIIVSPQLWDINIKGDFCYLKNDEETLHYKINAILLREGHLYPSLEYKQLVLQIKDSKIPCVNDPDVTLKCLDSREVLRNCKHNDVLSKYCFTNEILSDRLFQQKVPFVIKLPDFHGGFGKWLIQTQADLSKLLKNKIVITIGDHRIEGFLHKKPFISKTIFVEPLFKGKDLRIWVVKDRESDEYIFQGLERTVKQGEWLANRYTETYKLFSDINPELKNICLEASKILNTPDLFAVDLMQDKNRYYLLEIHNDVPGLKSLEEKGNYSIHKQLLKNCATRTKDKLLVSKNLVLLKELRHYNITCPECGYVSRRVPEIILSKGIFSCYDCGKPINIDNL